MFSSKEAAAAAAAAGTNPNYPTQWALNPSAYQNVDSSNVDWAALAQQWIAMKEAAAILAVPTGPTAKHDTEEGEAPMEVENPDAAAEPVPPPGVEWNNATNSWGNSGGWNQWGWGWGGAGVDPKMGADPSMGMAPMMDGFSVPSDGTAPMQGYTTGPAPTFQHGYWTAPQVEQPNNHREATRGRDRRSKSKNRDHKPSKGRTHRDKPSLPLVLEPVVAPTPAPALDAAKRRQLPAWIREGLEKMEREKQRAIEREQEKKAREEAEKEKKKLEEEELERMKAEAGGQPMMPAKSKFDSDSEGESEKADDPSPPSGDRSEGGRGEGAGERARPRPPSPIRTREEVLQEVMVAVRRGLTEVLLEVTDFEIRAAAREEFARFTAAQGLGAYESSSEESGADDEPDDLTDNQLQDIIKRKKSEFERTSREIEAEVRRAELREGGEASPHPHTPDPPPRRSRSSTTPPPEIETPEKVPDSRSSKNHKSSDGVDGIKRLDSTEEKSRKSSRKDHTPSPQKNNHKKETSSSSDSEADSSSSNESASSAEKRPSKRKRRSSGSSGSHKKPKKEKHKKDKSRRSTEKTTSKSKHYDYEKEKKRRDDRHKSSRSRDYERSHKDKYREDSDEDRGRKRSRRSRSRSYESRSSRRRSSRSLSRARRHERYDGRGRRRDRSPRRDRR